MRPRSLFFLILACAAVAASAFAASSEYATLLAALKSGNTAIDYTRLRLSYADSPERKHAKDTSDAEKHMFQALDSGDSVRALKDAETVLDSNYVNADAHFIAYAANKQQGSNDKAQFHLTVFRKLVDSIRSPGDGKSIEQAWVVISVDEEYTVLRALGLRPSSQALINKDGHSYDQMKTKDESGAEHILYFNVDIPMKHYGI